MRSGLWPIVKGWSFLLFGPRGRKWHPFRREMAPIESVFKELANYLFNTFISRTDALQWANFIEAQLTLSLHEDEKTPNN